MTENTIIAKFLDDFEAEQQRILQLDPRERAMQANYSRVMGVAYELREFLRKRVDAPVEQAAPVTVPSLQMLGYELDGVIADVEQGHGFDDVCLNTIKRARAQLAAAGAVPSADAQDAFIARLRAFADAEYCAGAQYSRRTECLGWEAKVKSGQFGKAELDAHAKMSQHFGANKGIYAAIDAALAQQKEGE